MSRIRTASSVQCAADVACGHDREAEAVKKLVTQNSKSHAICADIVHCVYIDIVPAFHHKYLHAKMGYLILAMN